MHPILKYLFFTYLLSSYKSLPGAYFIRFYAQIIKSLILPKFSSRFLHHTKTPFETISLKTYNSPWECDGYLHKSNSTYFEELDIARTKLMTNIFQKFFLEFPTESKSYPYVPVANVFTVFKKEIKPYQKYEVKSRVLGWDLKWVFILNRFVSKKGLHAVCITKYVLKDGRKTIKPIEALKFCGYDVTKYEDDAKKGLELVQWFVDTGEIEGVDV